MSALNAGRNNSTNVSDSLGAAFAMSVRSYLLVALHREARPGPSQNGTLGTESNGIALNSELLAVISSIPENFVVFHECRRRYLHS